MCVELIDAGIALCKDRASIRNAIEASKGFFNELKLEKLAENLKPLEATFFQKAYLAYKLTKEQRNELFSRLEFTEEKDEANALDQILNNSKEDQNINLPLLANNLNFKISDFGLEYMTWFITDDGVGKLRELKGGMLPDLEPWVDLTDEADDDENIPELEEPK
jgi:hypothetical protein